MTKSPSQKRRRIVDFALASIRQDLFFNYEVFLSDAACKKYVIRNSD